MLKEGGEMRKRMDSMVTNVVVKIQIVVQTDDSMF